MSTTDEDVVRRFYEQLCNERKNDLAADLFTEDHHLRDPQVRSADGPSGVAAAVSTYQSALDARWRIDDIFSVGDRVVVRWTGIGRHVGDLNGIPPTGRSASVDAISIHRMDGGRIAETWQVWDTLGLMQQLGLIPAST
jgi:steroid delta-isomerase-like uncharacterized protein